MTIKELYQWGVENECEDSALKMVIPYMHCGFYGYETTYEHEEIAEVDISRNENGALEVLLQS